MTRLRVIIIVILAFMPSLALAQWQDKDTALLGTALGLMALDWNQTRKITREPEPGREPYYENNPLMGKHPSIRTIDGYFITAMAGTTLIATSLSADNRRWFLGGVIAVETLMVLRNQRIGLKVEF